MFRLYLPLLQPPLTILVLFTLSSFLLHILVLIGSTSNSPFLRSLYFLRLQDQSHTPGVSQFFQVGLWNHCEGSEGKVSGCDAPKEFWWFDPMEEMVEGLFGGVGVPISDAVYSTINKARRASYCVFIFYFLALIFSVFTLVIDVTPSKGRWSPILSIFTSSFSAVYSTIATAISTALYCLYRNFFEDLDEIHIKGTLGRNMFVVMWAASIVSIAGSLLRVMCGCWNPERIRDGRGGEWVKIVRRLYMPRFDPV
ncbi:hypothetical protein L873DRAFT_770400 [Choiromyces venosus 120613-1]|uniref:SUR7-domain-containing protein n=1 Tax=Choiromyces venosus 120613-1 TaxID=1336337 RepID=A0A3N4JQ97_9PEZI|nr:hypothetical protein L873DRAFT_770400 [Choiromyces venosus 120613-1]